MATQQKWHGIIACSQTELWSHPDIFCGHNTLFFCHIHVTIYTQVLPHVVLLEDTPHPCETTTCALMVVDPVRGYYTHLALDQKKPLKKTTHYFLAT